MANRLKDQLANGETAVGTFCYIGSPTIVEVLGAAGADFVIIDMEHTEFSLETVAAMVRAAAATGVTPLVRIPGPDEKLVGRILELGAKGIVVPMAESADVLKEVVSWCKYAPDGERGVCRSSRASAFGAHFQDFGAYTRRANDDVLVGALIETVRGVDNAQEIVGSGIDMVAVGPVDLSASFGFPGVVDHPEVVRGIAEVIEAAKQHPGVAAAGFCFDLQGSEALIEQGVTVLYYGVDTSTIRKTYSQAFADAKSAASRHK